MSNKVRKAVFPAAGLGTRFLPATKASPKEMLPLVDKPLIQYAIEEAVASGIESILVITGRDKSAIENHFDISFELEQLLKDKGKDDMFEVVRAISDLAKISYTRQKQALGLGHAIYQAKDFVGDEPFAALLADDIIDAEKPALLQMVEVFEKYNAAGHCNDADRGRSHFPLSALSTPRRSSRTFSVSRTWSKNPPMPTLRRT